jgi:hypothetical protein
MRQEKRYTKDAGTGSQVLTVTKGGGVVFAWSGLIWSGLILTPVRARDKYSPTPAFSPFSYRRAADRNPELPRGKSR